jgi:hypothetical protein
MYGIAFFRTERLDDVVAFYTDRLDAVVWREHPDCTIFQVGDFGFCQCFVSDPEGRTVEK